MKKVIFPMLLVIAIFIVILSNKKTIERVCFQDQEYCFLVEIAETPEELQRGLMFRESLPENRGMLFIFPKEGVYSFWMKNTLIPLDIIWLDKEGKVVFISEKTSPCQSDPCQIINPKVPAKYVLEVNSGLAQKIGISVGEKATFH